MNLYDYSLERLAVSYLRDRDVDAARAHHTAHLRRRKPSSSGPFITLLRWWLRLTALLLRYPIDPARASAKLGAIGFPVALLATRRLPAGGGHAGR